MGIKSTKRCLKKMVGQANFSYDELLTAVVEIEAIINSRPLTHISSEDQEEPLTPSHLLCGYRLLSLPEHLTYCCPLDDEDFEVAPSEATRRVKVLHTSIVAIGLKFFFIPRLNDLAPPTSALFHFFD